MFYKLLIVALLFLFISSCSQRKPYNYGAIKVHYGYKLSDGWSRIYSAILYKYNDSTKGYAHYNRKNEHEQYTFDHDDFNVLSGLGPL